MTQYKTIAIRLSLESAKEVEETLKRLGSEGEKALKQIERAGQKPTAAMKALDAAISPAREIMSKYSAEAGVAGRVLSAFGATGTLVAAGVGAVSAVLWKGTEALLEQEKAAKRLNAVLEATGHAAGLTANQIDEFSQSLSKKIGVDDDAIKSTAATLAAFRSVSGDAFKGVIEQAANLSAVFGGDMDTNVQALGRSMEMLAGGQADGLRKAFKALTVAQESQIRVLAESGRGYEAQQALLKALQDDIGGAAEKMASAGSKIGVAWDDLLKHFGNTAPVHAAQNATLELLNTMNRLLEEDSLEEKMRKLTDARDRALSGNANNGRYASNGNSRGNIAALDAEIARLTKLADAEKSAQKAAEDSARQQQLQNELATEVDAEAKQTDEARKAAIETAKRESEERARAVQTIEDNIRALKDERDGLMLSERERFVHQKLIEQENTARHAGIQVTEAEASATRSAAESLFDAQQKQKDLNDIRSEAKSVIDSTRGSLERYGEHMQRLNKLMEAGAISQDTYNRAARKSHEEMMQGRTDAEAGIYRAFDEYEKKSTDVATTVQQTLSDAMTGTENAIAAMVTGGSSALDGLRNLANSVENDLVKMLVRQEVTGPLFSLLGGGNDGGTGILGTLLGSFFHDGGTVGDPTAMRPVPASAFVNAPRYHSGGIAGLKPDEIPAILQRGERVIPRGSRASSVNPSFAFNVTVSGPAGADPALAAQSGRMLATAAKAHILEVLQNEQRPGGQLWAR